MPSVSTETVQDVKDYGPVLERTSVLEGYAVNFVRLTREQQRDVLSRTFHGST